MAELDSLEDYVREKIEKECFTYLKLSRELQQRYPGRRGFSVRSIERFCSQKGIKRMSSITDQSLDEVVSEAAVGKVRRMILVCHFIIILHCCTVLVREKCNQCCATHMHCDS